MVRSKIDAKTLNPTPFVKRNLLSLFLFIGSPTKARNALILILVILTSPFIFGQDSESVRKANWELVKAWDPQNLIPMLTSSRIEPNWLPGSDSFWYSYRTTKGNKYWLVNPLKREKRLLFEHDRMAEALSHLIGEEFKEWGLRLGKIDFIEENRAIRFQVANRWLKYDLGSRRLIEAEPLNFRPQEMHENVSPDGRFSVFARGNNIFFVDHETDRARERQLSFDGTRGLSWGDDWELIPDEDTKPRYINAVWSPDSSKFFIVRADVRNVEDLWIIDYLQDPRPLLKTVKYPMPGENIPQWELWIFSQETDNMVQANISCWPDQHLVDLFHDIVWWSGDSSTLYCCRRSRDYLKADLCVVNPGSGACQVIIKERQNGMIYLQPTVELQDTNELIWWSHRDGWGHFYLYSRDGTLKNQITRGAFNAEKVVSVDEEKRLLFFLANGREQGRNPYYQHLYRVNLDGSDLRLLTPEDASHECRMCPSLKCFVDNYSRVDLPTRSVLRTEEGNLLMDLESSDVSKLRKAGWKPPEIFKAKAADRLTDLWGVMYKPFDFDPKNKYPLVTRVYPGRFDESFPIHFAPFHFEQYLANLGCVVVWFGNRGGSRLRGVEYREYGRSEFRDYGLADKKVVIEQLADRHDFIAIERVGIYGGSSGGFMAITAMLTYPDLFKVGVARTAPNDPNQYYNEWVERYTDISQTRNPDGSVKWDVKVPTNIELADRLKGHLLMMYGGMDEIVHLGGLFRMANAFIKAGKHFDMFIIPDAGHDLGDWYYSHEVMWKYFAEHLIEADDVIPPYISK